MIMLTKLNAQSFVLNSDLIETIEMTPDTIITMTTGKKFVVIDTQEEIMSKIITYKRKILLPAENK